MTSAMSRAETGAGEAAMLAIGTVRARRLGAYGVRRNRRIENTQRRVNGGQVSAQLLGAFLRLAQLAV